MVVGKKGLKTTVKKKHEETKKNMAQMTCLASFGTFFSLPLSLTLLKPSIYV
jgi:hypothetical protein